ncbi:MAG: PKD domain-containing protein, partial [bacterium]|nr:PKD domain-containing protein [bacterium]MDZ4296151.1 PKD domain-containing protein [Patescibacteria group bacterium]
SGLEFNRNYYWRVRTTDNHDLSSSFGRAAEGGSCVGGAACAFHTPPSAPPVAAFTFAPVSPIIGAPITFTDQSYDPGPPNEGNGDTGDTFGCPSGDCRVVSWNWTFGPTARRADNGTPIPSWSGKTPPAIVFPDRGTTAVTLQVTDNDGQSVATAKDVMVQPKLPIFKEIRPR